MRSTFQSENFKKIPGQRWAGDIRELTTNSVRNTGYAYSSDFQLWEPVNRPLNNVLVILFSQSAKFAPLFTLGYLHSGYSNHIQNPINTSVQNGTGHRNWICGIGNFNSENSGNNCFPDDREHEIGNRFKRHKQLSTKWCVGRLAQPNLKRADDYLKSLVDN